MNYRCQAASTEGVVQLIAASYLRHGYYWYVTGSIPHAKDAETVDRKLVTKYGLDISQWARSSRRKRGLANAQYLRYGRWFILMLTEGHHALRLPTAQGGEREQLKDCRRHPIQFEGYSISHRRSGVASVSDEPHKWRAHVRIANRSMNSSTVRWSSHEYASARSVPRTCFRGCPERFAGGDRPWISLGASVKGEVS